MIALPEPLLPISRELIRCNAVPLIVGGYVRDALLGRSSKDIDIEVYGVRDLQSLLQLLEPFGKVSAVGRSFGVLKLAVAGYDLDFALPRTESKTGRGHRGFSVRLDPGLDFTTAARRRDFTINAMGFDLRSGTLLDPYGGRRDLREATLRCVDPATFIEDPLRVLRAVQMAARFHLKCDAALLALCRRMVDRGDLEQLPGERIFEELKKLLLKAERPSAGLRLAETMHLLSLFPELEHLRNRHPTLWKHTLRTLDAMAAEHGDPELMFAALCLHLPPEETRRFLQRITREKKLTEAVIELIELRDAPLRLYREKAGPYTIRRLALRLAPERLLRFFNACHPDDAETAGTWLLREARACGATPEALEPLLQGRDLVSAGFIPSPAFKALLDTAYEAQLHGEFASRDAALAWFKAWISDSRNATKLPAKATTKPPPHR